VKSSLHVGKRLGVGIVVVVVVVVVMVKEDADRTIFEFVNVSLAIQVVMHSVYPTIVARARNFFVISRVPAFSTALK
jgi:hypothetical protein